MLFTALLLMKHRQKNLLQIFKVNNFGNWLSVCASDKVITIQDIYDLYFSPECPSQAWLGLAWKE